MMSRKWIPYSHYRLVNTAPENSLLMNRTFRFSPLWILLFFAGGLISCSNPNRGDQKNPAIGSRPNIIYILAGGLGYGGLGACGGRPSGTPSLARRSEEVRRLTLH